MKTAGSMEAEADELIALLEDENRALARMEIATVVASLARKRQLVEKIAAGSSGDGAKRMLDVARGRRLASASKRNATLLDAAIIGQRDLMKILSAALRGAEERKVYVRQGGTAALTRSVGLTIATSA